MPTSRHRKTHKQKSARRTQSMQQKREYVQRLTQDLAQQLQIIQNNPIEGVVIQPQEQVTLTSFGTLPSQEIKL